MQKKNLLFFKAPIEKSMIRLAMNDLEKYTCVKYFRQRNEKDYILIISGGGCYSYVGRTGGEQVVSLQKEDCFSRGTIIHELIHALGYDHMQNHSRRDKYITINWNNILNGAKQNFERVNPKAYSNYGTGNFYISSVANRGFLKL